MEFHCEDLRQFGVELIPPSSPEYDPLLADLQWRLEHPVPGSPPRPEFLRDRIVEQDRETSAILINRSQNGIVAIQQIRTFRRSDSRISTGSTGPGANPSVLLPYGLSEKLLKLYGYWHVILPGSKRYLDPDGKVVGDNTDVRLPEGDELWTGGIAGGGGGGSRSAAEIESVTLTLDGVFFTDGGFAGPNQRKMWEQIVATAEAHEELIRIAKEGRERGVALPEILAEIESVAPLVSRPLGFRPPRPLVPRGVTNPDDFAELLWKGWAGRLPSRGSIRVTKACSR